MSKCYVKKYHYFDIGSFQFSCYQDINDNKWYCCDTIDYIFGCDLSKQHKTKEQCEAYITKQVKETCKALLVALNHNKEK